MPVISPTRTAALAAGLALSVSGATGAAPVQAPRYVSMGSSYAAGPGVGRPDPASGACARSLSNYARRLAADRGLALVDVACSGATTDTILVHGQSGFAPQIEAVTPDTRLVSILIGGNDIAYIGDIFGYACRDTGGTGCEVVPPETVARDVAALPSLLRRVVDEVRRRAPGARIVLVGYVPVLSADGRGVCPAVPLSSPHAARIRKAVAELARAMEDVAKQTGAGLVRSWRVGAGHDACSADPFVAGADAPTTPGWPDPVAYHPNQAGMDRVAAALEAVLDQAGAP